MWEVIRRSTPGYVRTYLPLFQFLNFPFQTPSCLPHIKKKSLKRNQAVDAHVILISFFQNSTTWGSIKAVRLLLMSCYYCWYSGVVQVLYSMYNVASPSSPSHSPFFLLTLNDLVNISGFILKRERRQLARERMFKPMNIRIISKLQKKTPSDPMWHLKLIFCVRLWLMMKHWLPYYGSRSGRHF